ncbi:MAG: GNAT family N-acetyltransferase [Acetobacteraceae bacterium]
MRLVTPGRDLLPEYVAALTTGWSPNTSRDVSGEQLAAIQTDQVAFLDNLCSTGGGGLIMLPGGQQVERLPGPILWISDGAFCGSINLRFVPGSEALPAHVSGHIGYAVVRWKRRRGIATRALGLMLRIAAAEGLRRVQVTCDDDNIASRRVVEANGGLFAGAAPHPDRPERHKLLFWIATGRRHRGGRKKD